MTPKTKQVLQQAAALVFALAVLALYCWALAGCAAVERQAATLTATATNTASEAVEALREVRGAAHELSNSVAIIRSETVDTLRAFRVTCDQASLAMEQAQWTLATWTNVSAAVTKRVDVSTEHSEWLWHEIKTLWPYWSAALVALAVAVKRYAFGGATVPDDLRRIVRKRNGGQTTEGTKT
jgi:hypothetical protein